MSQAIIKKDIQKRLNPEQQEQFRKFRKECNIKMLNYQIERYSDSNHRRHSYFKRKTIDWTSPYWGNTEQEIILLVQDSSNGIGCFITLQCPLFGIEEDITDYESW